jgi:prevent-host-death family protein
VVSSTGCFKERLAMTESTSIGSFAAKTHLSELLERASRGERITITRRGKPMAMLVPPAAADASAVGEVVDRMLEHRRRAGPRLGKGLSIAMLRDEGRRF